MMRKKNIPGIFLLFILMVSSLSVEAGNQRDERVIYLPVDELVEVLSSWWERAGFMVQRTNPDKNSVRLFVSRGDAGCRFDLSPQSALAAKILTVTAVELTEEMDRWWRYLEVYIQAPLSETSPADHTIPVSILSKIESVVCIRITTGEEKDQFSGVIVDKAGLIISTAHGLPDNQEIMVTLYDGKELPGTLIRRDILQDLSLIQIPESAFQSISLPDGRNLLGMGEPVFSIGCLGDLQGTVTTGTVNAPPRRVNDQPLWQVHMDVQPGNSGSPVFDKQGHIVALVKGRYRGTTSVGFLIPLETIIHFVKESCPP
jgi:serine protease Do